MPSKAAWPGYLTASREDGRSILKGVGVFSAAQCFSASMLLRAEIGAIIGVPLSSHPLHETWLHLTHTLTIEERTSPLLLSRPQALLWLSSGSPQAFPQVLLVFCVFFPPHLLWAGLLRRLEPSKPTGRLLPRIHPTLHLCAP